MNVEDELSKIYKGLSEEDKEKAKLTVPRLMEALCNMDDVVKTGDHNGNTTFTIEKVHIESRLKSISRVTFTKIAKLCREVDEPLIDIDEHDNITLTDRGRTWCSIKIGG